MMTGLPILLTLTLIGLVTCETKCSTLTCVQTSSTILEKLDGSVEPCDDFHNFACGSFIENNFVDDEDDSVSTLSIMNNNLQEILLKIVEGDQNNTENARILDITKKMYKSCMDRGENCDDIQVVSNLKLCLNR